MDQTAPGVDLAPLMDSTLRHRKTADTLVQRLTSDGDLSGPPAGSLQRLLAVPSYATLHTLRRAVIEQGNQCPLVHKSLVQLDWVSSEDGSHVLTVAVGSRVLLFTPVSQDLIQQGGGGLEQRVRISCFTSLLRFFYADDCEWERGCPSQKLPLAGASAPALEYASRSSGCVPKAGRSKETPFSL